ncbi:amidase [Shouchella lonarensis]|uniref:Amidase n=1 Tax=Shouchella lonarensis TaxID=1464122 RepID=A0A1G6K110_9BACI|nr:amidase [Shouchella lonarensis]SDC23966.1 amidase [Shouchella lonarensis]
MNVAEYKQKDGVALANLIRKKEVKAEELVQTALLCMKENKHLNACVYHRHEEAIQEVAKVETTSLFAGVPFLLKNSSQALSGAPLTSGSALFKDHRSMQTSHYTKRLQDAGLLMLGYTNAPEFGLKNITEPRLYGATRNPHDPSRSPGGSSGGAAAAVASGIVPFAGASDGGGSIRIPAAFTGLVGLKPTRGRTPVGPGVGRQWQGAAIDFVISRSVRDSARALDVLQIVQPEAAFQTPLYERGYEATLRDAPKKLRIAYTLASPVHTPVSEDAKAAVRKCVRWLASLGHEVEEVQPSIDGVALIQHYYLMNAGEMASLRDRLEQAFGRALLSHELETESWLLSQCGKNVTASAYAQSLLAWDEAAAVMSDFHRTYDLYITPTVAHVAPKIGELTPTVAQEAFWKERVNELRVDEQLHLIYELFLPGLTYTPFTQLANLTGQPAISLPLYKTEEGLPLGVQFMAQKGKDELLLQIARMFEESALWCMGV